MAREREAPSFTAASANIPRAEPTSPDQGRAGAAGACAASVHPGLARPRPTALSSAARGRTMEAGLTKTWQQRQKARAIPLRRYVLTCGKRGLLCAVLHSAARRALVSVETGVDKETVLCPCRERWNVQSEHRLGVQDVHSRAAISRMTPQLCVRMRAVEEVRVYREAELSEATLR